MGRWVAVGEMGTGGEAPPGHCGLAKLYSRTLRRACRVPALQQNVVEGITFLLIVGHERPFKFNVNHHSDSHRLPLLFFQWWAWGFFSRNLNHFMLFFLASIR